MLNDEYPNFPENSPIMPTTFDPLIHEEESNRPFPPPRLTNNQIFQFIDSYVDATSSNNLKQAICCVCGERCFSSDTRLENIFVNHDLLIPSGENEISIYEQGVTEEGLFCVCKSCDYDMVKGKVPEFCRVMCDLGQMPLCIATLTLAESILISLFHVKYYVFTEKSTETLDNGNQRDILLLIVRTFVELLMNCL